MEVGGEVKKFSKPFELVPSLNFGLVNRYVRSPVGFLLLVLQVSVRLLELLRHDLQLPRQFVLLLKPLAHQNEISCRVVQGDVRQVQT